MLQRWKMGIICVALAAAPLVGCASAPRQDRAVYVRVAPPPARREVIATRPGRGYVYARGHWAWRGGEYAWVPGGWVRPERGHRWVDGRWRHDRRGWYYVEGHWR